MIHASAQADIPPAPSRTARVGASLVVLLGLALLVSALVSAAPAAAKKAPKGFFGITEGGSNSAADYQRMSDIKVRSKRFSINWRAAEPRPGVFTWARADAQVAVLARNGMSPFPIVWGAPQWATGSPNLAVPPLKGKALRAWKTFVKTAVNRYKKGGAFWRKHPTVPVHPAKSWQIWNEPNLTKYFAKRGNPNRSPAHAPKAYAKLVKATDKAVRQADGHAQVILAGLSAGLKNKKLEPKKFIKKLLGVKGIKKHFDAAALHPYAPKLKKFESRVSEFRRALNKNGAKKKPIWLTEVGWGSAHDRHGLNKGPAGQAKLLKQSFNTTLKHRKRWKVKHVYWFDWRDPPASAPIGCSFCGSAGLLRHDGSTKPAYKKFKRFAR
jgi:polysaccharide biosynthesis protein PslG